MQLSFGIISAALLLVDLTSATAISFSPRRLRRANDYDAAMQRTANQFQGELERRSPQSANPIAPNLNMNATVSTACNTAVSGISNVMNVAGFAGCYNILSWDPKTSMFQADLRIYQQSQSTGKFANISANQVTVMLTYPDTTQFKSMVKRSSVSLVERDGNPVQIQQYSLVGNIQQKVDVSKLNETLLASLMTPQIWLQAKDASSSNTVTTNMTATDSAWFVAGQFTDISAQAAQVADPATAAVAITAAQGFILPGTTFGIFPTGLIVTSVWTLIFVSAFAMGTVGRIKARKVYRKRMQGLAARGRI